ncbi:class F sortase [Streptomyces sp. NPDC093105]|uniref:class F sortase n=1 Tax=Streptomyces sp. NPDC093105 TaxID=3366029 RepID=UPI0038085D97
MAASSRPVTGVAWAVLLLGLWVWGQDTVHGPGGSSAPTHGDIAAVGRPLGVDLPPSRAPIPGAAEPRRVQLPALGIDAPVVPRGLDATGAVDPPPYELPHTVGWYGPGTTTPGAAGPALLVGHVDTDTRPAVFYHLSAARPGETVRVTRTDGSVAVFTVDDVRVVPRDAFDPRAVYGPRDPSRAELRLITCGGTFDRATATYTANVVVSAYLTSAE